jgi:MSHA pilin protein MshA
VSQGWLGISEKHEEREMKHQQSGFTLIELIMVIVILAALAVIAIPKYVDLKTEAEDAATAGVAGALGAASAINYAAAIAGGTIVTVANCAAVENALTASLPTEYTITGTFTDGTGTCTVAHSGGSSASFVGHQVPLP